MSGLWDVCARAGCNRRAVRDGVCGRCAATRAAIADQVRRYPPSPAPADDIPAGPPPDDDDGDVFAAWNKRPLPAGPPPDARTSAHEAHEAHAAATVERAMSGPARAAAVARAEASPAESATKAERRAARYLTGYGRDGDWRPVGGRWPDGPVR